MMKRKIFNWLWINQPLVDCAILILFWLAGITIMIDANNTWLGTVVFLVGCAWYLEVRRRYKPRDR